MTTNILIHQIDGKAPLELLPENMDAKLLTSIAEQLSKWRQGALANTKERVELEEFAQRWGTIVLPSCRPGLAEAMYDERNCILTVLIVMGELDYLVQQEIVSRELSYRTYRPTNLFDRERLKFLTPQFVSTFFEYNGMRPIATEQVRTGMSASVERFLNDCLANPNSENPAVTT